MKIDQYSVVTIRYTLTGNDGEIIDESDEQELLTYMHGTEYLVPGLERAITGHEKGDRFKVDVSAADGYGEYRDSLVSELPVSMFAGNEIHVGDTFIAQTEEGQIPVTVQAVNGDKVVVDGNHPLAGVDLHFAIEIVDVRDPTESEREHGHVHVDGHCGDEEHSCCCHRHDHDDEDGDDGHHHCCCHHHDHDDGDEHHHHHDHDHHHDHEDGHDHDDAHSGCCHHHDEDGEEGEEDGGHHCCSHHHDHEDGDHHGHHERDHEHEHEHEHHHGKGRCCHHHE